MTIGNWDVPCADHPFLRHATSPDPQNGIGDSEPRPLPDMASDSDIGQAISDRLAGWDRFCTLAINIDAPAKGMPPESLDRLVMDLIAAAQETHGAIGCPWEERLYFCALPHIDMQAALEFSENMHASVAAQRPETISIGIAPYPLLAYDKQRSGSNACKALNHAAFLGPGSIVALDAVSLNISGDRLYQSGRLDEAIEEYSAALELDPNDINVRNSLGVCFAEMNDISAGEAEFKIVTEIAPLEPMAWYNLGVLNRLQDRAELSLSQFQKAQAIKSDYYEIPFQIGKILSEQHRWEEALKYADKAVALNQKNWAIHSLRGQCLTAMERVPEAIRAYTKAVKINPNNAADLSALGCLYGRADENPDICRAFLEQSVDLAPDNGLFHHRLGTWLQKQKQFDLAESSYRQAIAWGHDSAREMESLQIEWQKEQDQTTHCTG